MFKNLIILENFQVKVKVDSNVKKHKNDTIVWNNFFLKKKNTLYKTNIYKNKRLSLIFNFKNTFPQKKIKLNNMDFFFLKRLSNFINSNKAHSNKNNSSVVKYGIFLKTNFIYIYNQQHSFLIKAKFNLIFIQKNLFFQCSTNKDKSKEYVNSSLHNWLPNFNFTYSRELYYKKNRKQYYFKLVFLSSSIKNLWINFLREYFKKYKITKKLLYWSYIFKKVKISNKKLINFLSKKLEKDEKNPINIL